MEAAFLLLRYGTGQPAAVYRFDGLTRDEVGHVLAALHQTRDSWLNALSVVWAADVDVPTRIRLGLEQAGAKDADAANWLRPNTGNAHDARKAAASFEWQIREVRTGSGSDCQNDASRPENKPSTPECALARRVTPCSIKVGVGFEPTKNGFAIRPVGPLWHPTIQ